MRNKRVDEIEVSITQLVWKEEERRKNKDAVSDRNTAVLMKKCGWERREEYERAEVLRCKDGCWASS